MNKFVVPQKHRLETLLNSFTKKIRNNREKREKQICHDRKRQKAVTESGLCQKHHHILSALRNIIAFAQPFATVAAMKEATAKLTKISAKWLSAFQIQPVTINNVLCERAKHTTHVFVSQLCV